MLLGRKARREEIERRLAAQRQAFGLPEDAFASKPDDDEDVEIWPENFDAYLAFVDCDTYWRRSFVPMTGLMIWDGLMPEGVREVLRAHGHRGQKYRDVWADLKVMERAALEVLNRSD